MKKIFPLLLISMLFSLSLASAIIIGNDSAGYAINSPVQDRVYYSIKVLLNISSNETFHELKYTNLDDNKKRCSESQKIDDKCWELLCKDCQEYGFSSQKRKTMVEGVNDLVFRIAYENGSVSYSYISIIVNSLKPKIYSISPRKGEFVNGSYFSIVYSEVNLKDITLVYGNENRTKNISQNCTPGKMQKCSFTVNLSSFENQPIYYYFIVNNLIYAEVSQTLRLFVDTITPDMIIYNPVEDYIFFKKVKFNITSSENVRLEYLDETENNPSYKKLCSNCNEYGFEKTASKSMIEGRHNLLIKATDRAGNQFVKRVSYNVEK